MNIQLNVKMIKEMCGEVSFKRGEAFYRANKVVFLKYTSGSCEALVQGKEDMTTSVDVDTSGKIRTHCSCPKLSSYSKECQHVAAVLLAIFHKERDNPSHLTDGFFSIFDEKQFRSSGEQNYFENREVIDIAFYLKPIRDKNGSYLFGIEVEINSIPVLHIYDFFNQVKKGLPHSNIFNPTKQCFKSSAEKVIGQLIEIAGDEEFFKKESQDLKMLFISPSSWYKLLPLLMNHQEVTLEYGDVIQRGLRVSDGSPSLPFHLRSEDGENGQLFIEGIYDMLVMPLYGCVLDHGVIIQLNMADCKRLISLQEMLDASNSQYIPIGKEQLPFFKEKVLPGLRKLGTVTISESLSKKLMKHPLVAKLYLDRVNHRLLAGLEFHYGNLVINPLDVDPAVEKALLVRERAKENLITQMMEESQFATTDEGYFLHNEELEYEFLTRTLPKLQELVQVYATTAVKNRIVKGNVHPKIRVKVKRERTNWLEFKFDLGVPEEEIRGVLHALEVKRKYYRLKNGSLLSLETREFEEVNCVIHSLPIQDDESILDGLDVPLLKGISFLEQIMDSPTFSPEESFHQFLEDIKSPKSLLFDVPENLAGKLRDYQKQGFHWLKTLASYGFGGILADDMGLGKTLQSIAYIQSVLPVIQEKKQPVLIVCPTSVTYNWLSEFMKFTPGITAVVADGDREERRKLHHGNADVIITSYTLLRQDLDWFKKQSFHTIFFDEAQAFKNPTTQTFKAAKQIEANHRFALTGTPVENSLEELWAIFHVVFPELFKGLSQYAHLTKKQIARRVRPFLLRRMKKDVLGELPEKIELQESVELLPEQKKLYAAYLAKLRHDTLKHLDKETIRKNRIKILAGITRLRQICCHPALFVDGYKGGSAKFDKLLHMIEESKKAGRRVLIFSQFTKMLELIGRQLAIKGMSFFYLDGGTPSEERVDMCERFNGGEHDFFLISLKAGGTGLNLTGADTVIFYDIWWNPAVEEQAMDRAYRMGQENTVKVIKLLTKGTIEEKIDQLQERKRLLIEEIIDPEETRGMDLTEEDIRDLLMVEPVER